MCFETAFQSLHVFLTVSGELCAVIAFEARHARNTERHIRASIEKVACGNLNVKTRSQQPNGFAFAVSVLGDSKTSGSRPGFRRRSEIS